MADTRCTIHDLPAPYRDALEGMSRIAIANSIKMLAIVSENGADAYVIDDGHIRIEISDVTSRNGNEQDIGVIEQLYDYAYTLLESNNPKDVIDTVLSSLIIQAPGLVLKRVADELYDEMISNQVEHHYQERLPLDD